MSEDKTVYEVEQKTKRKKWFDVIPKDRVVVDKDDFEWLKSQAVQVVGLKSDVERLRKEVDRLTSQLVEEGGRRRKAKKELNRQKSRNKLLINMLKDNGLYDLFLEKVDEIRSRKRKQEENELDV